MKFARIILAVLITLTIVSCASIPKATVTMSERLKDQIEALQTANERLINMVFDEKEKHVLSHIDDVFLPQHIKNIFHEPYIDSVWQNMLDSADISYRYEVAIWLNKNIHTVYLETKDSLLNPIQEERNQILSLFKKEFDMAIRMNTTITHNISSAEEINAIYEKYASELVDIDNLDSILTTTIKRIDMGLDKKTRSY